MASRIRQTLAHVLSSGSAAAVALQTLATQAGVLALGVAVSMIAARSLGATGRGELEILLLWPALLSTLGTLGLHTSYVYHTRKSAGSARESLRIAIVLATLWSLLPAVIGCLLLPRFTASHPPGFIAFAQVYVLVVTPLATAAAVATGCAQAAQNFRLYNVGRILPPVALLLMLAGLGAWGHVGPRAIALAFAASTLLGLVVTLEGLRRSLPPPDPHARVGALSLLRYGGSVYAVDILGAFSTHVDRFFILAFLTSSELGVYAVALGLARILREVQTVAASVAFTRSAGLPIEAVVRQVGQAFRVSAAVGAALAVVLLVLGQPVLTLLYGGEYAVAVVAFQLLILEAFLSASSWVLVQVFNAAGRPGLIVLRQALALCLVVVLLALLVPRYGIEGAAVALLAGALVRLGITLAAFPMALGQKIPRLIVTGNDVRAIARQLGVPPAKEISPGAEGVN